MKPMLLKGENTQAINTHDKSSGILWISGNPDGL